MSLFSRCYSPDRFEMSLRTPGSRRGRPGAEGSGLIAAISGFAEDISILFRYAAGLDYYGRDRPHLNR